MPASRPNLFSYATSELSQDAFLAWLLEWADKDYRQTDAPLHSVAVNFVQELSEAADLQPPEPPFSVEVLQQVNGEVDIVVLAGDGYALVIEDKVDTSSHSNQLQRYREAMRDKIGDRELGFVYLKTGDQSSYRKVRERGWSAFTRDDLLRVLHEGENSVENAIFGDFLEHLEAIEARFRRYETIPIEEWEPRDDAYKGLFTALQNELGEGNWDYVHTGDFIGFWWGWFNIDGGKVYLQLHEEILEVRIEVPEKAQRSELRNTWSKRVVDGVPEWEFERPQFGHGETMRIADGGDYRVANEDGLLDLEETASRLRDIQDAIEELVIEES